MNVLYAEEGLYKLKKGGFYDPNTVKISTIVKWTKYINIMIAIKEFIVLACVKCAPRYSDIVNDQEKDQHGSFSIYSPR